MIHTILPGSKSAAGCSMSRHSRRVFDMVTNYALGLPGGKGAKRSQLGDDALNRAVDVAPHHAHRVSHSEPIEMVFPNIKRSPPIGSMHTYRIYAQKTPPPSWRSYSRLIRRQQEQEICASLGASRMRM